MISWLLDYAAALTILVLGAYWLRDLNMCFLNPYFSQLPGACDLLRGRLVEALVGALLGGVFWGILYMARRA